MITSREREILRRRFRPARVRLLFIGESPPASGRFFYSSNSGLYRAMREAFQIADPKLGDEDFLTRFQALGCYLTDLSHQPVDDLEIAARRRAREKDEERLAREIARLHPVMIAPLLRAIVPHVKRAVARAKWNGAILELPYPGRWIRHREAFLHELVPILPRLSKEATLMAAIRTPKRERRVGRS